MTRLFLIFSLVILIWNNDIKAQDTISRKKNNAIDERYIEKYNNIPAAYLSIYGKYNNISLVDLDSGRTLTYKPNISLSFGPGFGYKWFGIDLSLISFGKLDENTYGKTKKTDIQSHLYLKRFIADFVYQDYKGFYLDSMLNKDTTRKINNQTTIRPDIQQQSLGGTFMYFTNYKRFSFKSTFSQTEFQKKSAGTWAFGVNFHILSISGDSSLVSNSLKSFFDSSSYIKKISSYNFGVVGGYFHTFTSKRWFVTISLLGGLDSKKELYTLEDNIERKDTINLSGRLQARLGTGFNFNRVYFGINVIGDGYYFTNSKQEYGTVRIYFGYRFTPKISKI